VFREVELGAPKTWGPRLAGSLLAALPAMSNAPPHSPPALDSETVVRENYEYVWRSLARLGVPYRDIEDLTQEVFLTVHHRLSSFDASRPLRPWLFGIAYNVMRADRRLARNKYERADAELDSSPATDTRQQALDAMHVVHTALRELDPERRAVFIMYELDGLDAAAIADELEIPRNTVYSRLRVAREEFTRAVEKLEGREVAS
jgi:RNA polymerase sigma-70 factor (ECF subfamily)